MNKEIRNIIEATSMGKLEKEAVIISLLGLHSVVGRSERLNCVCEDRETAYTWEMEENKCKDCGRKLYSKGL